MENQQLREHVQRLEQENDDLQSSVRRLEATEETLKHKLERAEEEVVFAAQEIETLKLQSDYKTRELSSELEKYENAMERLLTAVGLPVKERCTGVERSGKDEGNHANPVEDNDKYATSETTTDEVEMLRAELKAKTEELQTTHQNYEEFMAVSYELERAFTSENEELKSENEELKRLIDKIQVSIR
ncbi:hypothetical protein AM587_10015406 [Phytophthora nicotianae]|uniref:Uncharacterized protein n=2 Tax=Phytophthora nicotianae TaxID=4792 RepID=A0A0W8CP90_PHYNI|nr:hypothetical protein AM587_10015406 [Phytophthora nicotianae]